MQATSLEAYRTEIEPTLGERQKKVLELFGTQTLTNSEIATRLGWSINRVTPRVFELRQAGKLEEAYKRICSITGRRVIAWKLKRENVAQTLF